MAVYEMFRPRLPVCTKGSIVDVIAQTPQVAQTLTQPGLPNSPKSLKRLKSVDFRVSLYKALFWALFALCGLPYFPFVGCPVFVVGYCCKLACVVACSDSATG